MQNIIQNESFYCGATEAKESDGLLWLEESYLGVVEHLKEEFGDYADPMTYSWTRRGSDD